MPRLGTGGAPCHATPCCVRRATPRHGVPRATGACPVPHPRHGTCPVPHPRHGALPRATPAARAVRAARALVGCSHAWSSR
eukprot:4605239-Prymnesium_polylepis.2